jgi:hypothetical protein
MRVRKRLSWFIVVYKAPLDVVSCIKLKVDEAKRQEEKRNIKRRTPSLSLQTPPTLPNSKIKPHSQSHHPLLLSSTHESPHSSKFTPHTLQPKPNILEHFTSGFPLLKPFHQRLNFLLHSLPFHNFFLKNPPQGPRQKVRIGIASTSRDLKVCK